MTATQSTEPAEVPAQEAERKLDPQMIESMRDANEPDEAQDAELRESIKELGFLKELAVIVAGDGQIIVGHRRVRIAKELGIEPVVVTLDGDDAYAIRLAIASNLGAKPFTKKERRKIARELYGTGEFSCQAIADVLGVARMTISRDVAGMDRTDVIPPGTRERVRELHAEGNPSRGVARMLGIGQTSVLRILSDPHTTSEASGRGVEPALSPEQPGSKGVEAPPDPEPKVDLAELTRERREQREQEEADLPYHATEEDLANYDRMTENLDHTKRMLEVESAASTVLNGTKTVRRRIRSTVDEMDEGRKERIYEMLAEAVGEIEISRMALLGESTSAPDSPPLDDNPKGQAP
jgi:ParB-like chromosome segregation protein Spo0J